MMFVYPLFLWALAAVAIPIIIHLFNFRKYTKVYFTNVKFLKELQQESKSKSRLKEILILLARCLAIVCLVLAFAQPIIQDKEEAYLKKGAAAISLYIDNSFSMENVNKQGRLLDNAKTKAKEVVSAFSGMDKFQIITNDFEGKHQRFNSKEDAINAIEEIKVSSSVRFLSDVVKRQRDFLKSSNLNNKKIYLFSDAQKSTFNILDVSSDTTIKTTVIPCATSQINNVFIDSCWFETPLQQKGFVQKLHASITNKGNARIDIGSAKLTLNKQQIAIASFSLDANSKNDIQFTFECKQNGFNYGSIKIEDYPITFDDELFFTFNSKLNISVALINGKETNTIANTFSSLFTGDSLFNFRSFSEQTIDYGVFKTSDVVILNQLTELSSGLVSELLKYSNQGGSIVIIPSSKLNLVLYNQAFSQLQLPALLSMDSTASKVDKIEVASKFYEGVFEKIEERLNLPLVNKHYKVQKNSHLDFESILLLQSGDPLLGKSKLNSASVYLFLAALNETSTNFNKHALFVPTFYQICFKSLKFVPLFYPVSDNVVINLKNDLSAQEQPPHIQQSDKLFDVIPEKRSINNSLFLYTQHQINQAGFYQIAQKDSVLLPLAFNFSRQESDLFCYGSDELEKIIADKGSKAFSFIEDTGSNISTLILQEAEGKKLWKLFIILTLFFIALEVTLLRLLK